MGIPHNNYGGVDQPKLLWLRRDWMLASGKKAPRTFTELEDIIKTFMSAYPGSYGIGLEKNLEAFYDLATGFKAYDGWIKDTSGKIVKGATLPEMKEALALFADWYKKGYIRRDFTSMNTDALRQDVVSGKVGIQYFWQWWGWWAGNDVIKTNGPESYFESYELPSKDGSLVSHPVGFLNDSYKVFNKNSKYIDAVCKLMSWNLWFLLDAVSEGLMTIDEYNNLQGPTAQGAHYFGQSFQTLPPKVEGTVAPAIAQAKKTGDTSHFNDWISQKYNYGLLFAKSGDLAGIGDFLQSYSDKAAYVTNSKVVAEGRIVKTYPRGPWPEEIASYGTTLDDMLTEGFTKIIIGVEPLSYFETLVASWKAAGGDRVGTILNSLGQ
jgi:putative aldouronate transport system substrate-binding protein